MDLVETIPLLEESEILQLRNLMEAAERIELERHRRTLHTLKRVFASIMAAPAVGAEKGGCKSPARLVHEAARTFGNSPFSLSDLVTKIAEMAPLAGLSSAVVSRRLYDLKHANPPVILEAAQHCRGNQAANFPMQRKTYIYAGSIASPSQT